MCFFLYRYGYVWRNRKSGQHPGYGCHQQWQLVSHGPSLAPLALKMDDPKGNSPIRILLAEEVGAVNQSWPWQWTMGNWNVWRQAALTYPAPQHSVKETSTAVGCATELCRDRLPWQTLLFNILPRILPQLQLLSCAETGCCDRPCSSTFYQGYCPSYPSGSEKQHFLSICVRAQGVDSICIDFSCNDLLLNCFFDGELGVHARVHLPCILPAMLVQSHVCIQQDSSGVDVTVTWEHGVGTQHLPIPFYVL